LSAQIDRLIAGDVTEQQAASLPGELDVARRLVQMAGRLPPVPVELRRRVGVLARYPFVSRRPSLGGRRWQTATWSALGTAAVLVVLWLVLPGLGPSGSSSAWAQVRAVLLGQTRVEVTPTLTPITQVRERLRDLVAAELSLGRAPSLPKTLPAGYSLQESAAISYPDLPAWFSQPLCVEFCYGDDALPCAVRLRQYRLLSRDFGGISGVKVAGDAVRDVEQVELQGATAMRFSLVSEHDPSALTQILVWERDGLLLELESEVLEPEQLIEIAGSTR
jgi:hypothetical protein